MNKSYIGITRFSLVSPQSKAWEVSQTKNYLDRLFDPSRMEDRLKIFSYSMESLKISVDATSEIVYHFVFYSDVLPQKYKKQLLEVCNTYDFIQPIELRQGALFAPITLIEKFFLNKKIIFSTDSVIGIYNLDDDDFLSTDYFAYSNRYMKKEFIGFRVSYGAGLLGFFNTSFFNIKESYLPKVNIGILTLAYVVNGKIKVPPITGHMFLDKVAPVILDSQNFMYFWTRHKGQDTNTKSNNNFGLRMSNVDDFLPVEKKAIESKFPVIARNMIKEKVLIDVREDVETISFTNLGLTKFYFKFKKFHIKKLKPLVSFIFYNEHNEVISELDTKAVDVVLSGNQDIGLYRYLTCNEDLISEFFINIPLDVSRIDMTINNRGNDVEIINFKLIDMYI